MAPKDKKGRPGKHAPQAEKEDDDGRHSLKSIMMKYKDRVHDEKDETMLQAEQDWDRFQNMSVEESAALGGSQSTTHLVKGLDVELLRRQREQLQANEGVIIDVQEQAPVMESGPTTALGKSIVNVLFNPMVPHPHDVHFRDKLDRHVAAISKLPLDGRMEGASTFFEYGRSKFIFKQHSDMPVVVMKSLSEIEQQASDMRNRKYCVRLDPDIIESVGAAMKRTKKSKKDKKPAADGKSESSAAMAMDDDLDIFGGFDAPAGAESANVTAVSSVGGTYFKDDVADVHVPVPDSVAVGEDVNRHVHEALRKREEMRRQTEEQHEAAHGGLKLGGPRTNVTGDDDYYTGSYVAFGERLDLSAFDAVDEGNGGKGKRKGGGKALSQSQQKKHKAGEEKQLLNKVMKKMDELNR